MTLRSPSAPESSGRRPAQILIATATTCILLLSGACSSQDPTTIAAVPAGGLVQVSDGDTVRTVSLQGIALPEQGSDEDGSGCLADESARQLEELLPVGAGVTVDAAESGDAATVTLTDGRVVNAELVRAGLAHPLSDATDSVLAEAQTAAAQAEAGFYSTDIECTVPAQFAVLSACPAVAVIDAAVTTAPTTTSSSAGTSSATASTTATTPATTSPTAVAGSAGTSTADLQAAAAKAAATAAAVDALKARWTGSTPGIAWTALNTATQNAFRSALTDCSAKVAADAAALRSAATAAADADRAAAAAEEARKQAEAKAAEDARVAEEARKVEAARQAEVDRQEAADRQAEQERQDARDRQAQADADAAAAERERQADSQPTSSGGSSGGGAGYTGPRCYAPGGKTWKPC